MEIKHLEETLPSSSPSLSTLAPASVPAPAPPADSPPPPSPWQSVFHPESGNYYFWNTDTGEVSWTLPAPPLPSPSPSPSPSSSSFTLQQEVSENVSQIKMENGNEKGEEEVMGNGAESSQTRTSELEREWKGERAEKSCDQSEEEREREREGKMWREVSIVCSQLLESLSLSLFGSLPSDFESKFLSFPPPPAPPPSLLPPLPSSPSPSPSPSPSLPPPSPFHPSSLFELFLSLRVTMGEWRVGVLTTEKMRERLRAFSDTYSRLWRRHQEFLRQTSFFASKIIFYFEKIFKFFVFFMFSHTLPNRSQPSARGGDGDTVWKWYIDPLSWEGRWVLTTKVFGEG